MSTEKKYVVICCLTIMLPVANFVSAVEVDEIQEILCDAEQRFRPPSEKWFEETQQILKTEVQRLGQALEAEGEPSASEWKSHFHWELLERNLGPRATVNLAEVELVRRSCYFNRRGLESPRFAPLREQIVDYLDVVFTLSQKDLRSTFIEKVSLLRRQSIALAECASDATAANLGRTLGWFERTRQLSDEVAAIRSLMSLPNAQLIISPALVHRFFDRLTTDVTEVVAVADRMSVPSSGLLQRSRTLQVRGSSNTTGQIGMEFKPNQEAVEITLSFQGWVESICRARTGRMTFHLETKGSVQAFKPFRFGPLGLWSGETSVDPHVTSRVISVNAPSALVRRIGARQANRPQSQVVMNARARSMTADRLTQRFDERVQSIIETMRGDSWQLDSPFEMVEGAFAPVVREGATPYFHSARTSEDQIVFNVCGESRSQLGASVACPIKFDAEDVVIRAHASIFNNTIETMLGGKNLLDVLFMRSAEIMYEELPLPLMVHSRSRRWSIRTTRQRPLEIRTAGHNRFEVVFRAEAVYIDGEGFIAPSTTSIVYDLTQNEFGEHQLVRDGDVEIETTLPAEVSEFLYSKVDAFFGPILYGGGVVVPDGGPMGLLKELKSWKVHAENNWVVVATSVPNEVIEQLIQFGKGDPALNKLSSVD